MRKIMTQTTIFKFFCNIGSIIGALIGGIISLPPAGFYATVIGGNLGSTLVGSLFGLFSHAERFIMIGLFLGFITVVSIILGLGTLIGAITGGLLGKL